MNAPQLKKIALVKITYTNCTENECIYEGQESQLIELLNAKDVVSYEFLRGEDFTANKEVILNGTIRTRETNHFGEYEFSEITNSQPFIYNPSTKKYTWIGDACGSNLNTKPQKLKKDSVSEYLLINNNKKFRV